MSKKRKFYEGTLEELKFAFCKSNNYEYTEKNFELSKKWLEIRLKLGAITKEEYDKELKELKEKYGIKD